jgi:hypothetical protein
VSRTASSSSRSSSARPPDPAPWEGGAPCGCAAPSPGTAHIARPYGCVAHPVRVTGAGPRRRGGAAAARGAGVPAALPVGYCSSSSHQQVRQPRRRLRQSRARHVPHQPPAPASTKSPLGQEPRDGRPASRPRNRAAAPHEASTAFHLGRDHS